MSKLPKPRRPYAPRIASVLLPLLLGGCSWFAEETAKDDKAPVLPPLEVPPDLIHPQGDPRLARPELPAAALARTEAPAGTPCRCDEPPRIGERVLPEGKGVQRVREGQNRWLRVSAEPEQVWPLVRKFLDMRGYRINTDEPAVGLLETGWKPIAGADGNTTDWRERLRIRVEPAEQAGFTELYLSQHSSERVTGEDGETRWQLQAPDRERAIEMLNRLAQYLAAEDVQDAVSLDGINSRLDSDDGATVLVVDAPYETAWRRIGLALDNLGFVIEDRDRSNGNYRIYNEISIGKSETELKYGRPQKGTVQEKYTVRLVATGEQTRVGIRTPKGEIDNSQAARHLLSQIGGQLQ